MFGVYCVLVGVRCLAFVVGRAFSSMRGDCCLLCVCSSVLSSMCYWLFGFVLLGLCCSMLVVCWMVFVSFGVLCWWLLMVVRCALFIVPFPLSVAFGFLLCLLFDDCC